jgi:fatty-acyl-CoA synthase
MMPACGGRIPIGVEPEHFAKTESNFCLVRLVDETGRDVEDGETGELIARGPTMFSGYWANDAATAEAFAGGWYHTGDLFRRRADGTLDYVDRKKYLVKSGGENIYPAEIERVVMRVPGVSEAVIVRRSDDRWGEVPVLVVTSENSALTGADLQEHCRARLARYKCPKAVYFVEPAFWPRNNTGKILRHEVEGWVKRQASGLPA